jgi:hypothetical protein
MPKLQAEEYHATYIATLLHKYEGLDHLRTRRRGDVVTIESGPEKEPHAHARLRRDTVHFWRLQMATHTGRWEPTPVRASLEQAVATLVESFGWTLTPIV